MKKTMLTYKTLDRFEAENDVLSLYTNEQIEKIEYCAYVANMNRCSHPDWTDDDVYDDFLRVLAIEKIPVGYPAEEPTIKYPYLHEITIDGLTFGAEQVVWRVEKLTHDTYQPYAIYRTDYKDDAEKTYRAYLMSELGDPHFVRMYAVIEGIGPNKEER